MAVQPRNVDICFLGDSITQRFPWQDYYREYVVVNRGIGSDTTDGILARLDSVVALNPKVIILLAGINDFVRDRTSEDIGATYEQILSQLKDELPEAKLVAISILQVLKDENIPKEDIIKTNALIQEVCNEQQVQYIDMFSVLADDDQYLNIDYASDNVHLNIKGYQLYCSTLNDSVVIGNYTDE